MADLKAWSHGLRKAIERKTVGITIYQPDMFNMPSATRIDLISTLRAKMLMYVKFVNLALVTCGLDDAYVQFFHGFCVNVDNYFALANPKFLCPQ